jgi:hypothetical protein
MHVLPRVVGFGLRDVTGHVTGHVGGYRSADVAQISGWLPYYRTIRR